jgi:hypothetical protein
MVATAAERQMILSMPRKNIMIDKTAPIQFDNVAFIVDKLGKDCAPLQFVRELTQNSIEAILACGGNGTIVWDFVSPERLGIGLDGAPKLMIIDDGCGMTGEEILAHINKLGSPGGGKVQDFDANYGVGAKISALYHNPEGVLYLSWKDGRGVSAHLHMTRDPKTGKKEYGLKMQNVDTDEWREYGDAAGLKPRPIKTHGTAVVLMGKSAEDDTTKPPLDVSNPLRWVQRYLNTRYFRFPTNIEVKARAQTSDKALSTVTGQQAFLDSHSLARGVSELTDVVVRWWILDKQDEAEAGGWSKMYANSGHVAFLHKDELYEMTSGKGSYHRLTSFGIIFGKTQVVLYVEPKDGSLYESDLTRSHVKTEDSPTLPWADWGEEFARNLPPEIQEHQLRMGASAQGIVDVESLQLHIKRLSESGLLRISPYRPVSAQETPEESSGSSPNDRGGGSAKGSTRKPKPEVSIPDVLWVSAADGTREVGDLEDRAARYIPERNLLLINKDFRVFQDMVDYWARSYSHFPGAAVVAEAKVRELVGNMLVENVMRAVNFRGSRTWTKEEVDRLYSEETLTAIVLQVSLPYEKLRRDLGTRLGSARLQA